MKIGEIVQTKSFWGGVSFIALGVVRCFSGDFVGGIQNVVAGFTTMFVRAAIGNSAK